MTDPKIQMSRLREIGWTLWDPIGLRNADGTWDDACADEYDTYLLRVVSLISCGGSRDEASEYLARIASEHMGLPHSSWAAAEATAEAIASYLLSVTDGPGSIT